MAHRECDVVGFDFVFICVVLCVCTLTFFYHYFLSFYYFISMLRVGIVSSKNGSQVMPDMPTNMFVTNYSTKKPL